MRLNSNDWQLRQWSVSPLPREVKSVKLVSVKRYTGNVFKSCLQAYFRKLEAGMFDEGWETAGMSCTDQ